MQINPIAVQKPVERRRHQRVRVSLIGRYMLADRREFPCQTIDMSPGGLAMHAPVKGAVGERVVIYLDQVGRVEGVVARHLDTGFAISMSVPALKREKLADQLTWLANRHALGMKEDRRHERIEPVHKRTTLHLQDGRELHVKLIDISLSGAAMQVDYRAPIGTPVTIGETPARIVRVFDGGVAVEFVRAFDPEIFNDRTKL
ncbi:MAG: PilZ domain-containing protein [Methylobacteriaceae bacterium]|nr:PilZ domain-containing protein [Methylobacteriaceae bacterium]